MQYFTRYQMAAARGLLGWSQKDLARETNLSADLISKIEKGDSDGSDKSKHAIFEAFHRNSIEFTEAEGVRRSQGNVTIYKGRDGFASFRQDVLREAQRGPIDICVSNVDERLFDKWGKGEVNESYREQMAKIETVKCRILTREQDNLYVASGFAEYRWLPKNKFGEIPFYIFGDKTCVIAFEDSDLSIFILNHPLITRFYRKQFEETWQNAIVPPKG
jgi:transcriptional regulator with XRE-family HTH domain